MMTAFEWIASVEHEMRHTELCAMYRDRMVTSDEFVDILGTIPEEERTSDLALNAAFLVPYESIGRLSLWNRRPMKYRPIIGWGPGAPRPFVWFQKEKPDNCLARGVVGRADLIALETLEEHGFVGIGNWMFSRTIQPYAYVAAATEDRMTIEPSLLAFPRMQAERFSDFFDVFPAVGGGIAFEGQYEVHPIGHEFAARFGVPEGVETVTVCLASRAKDQWHSMEIPDDDGIHEHVFGEIILPGAEA